MRSHEREHRDTMKEAAEAVARLDLDSLTPLLASGTSCRGAKLFLGALHGKRRLKLERQLDLVRETVERIEAWFDRYVVSVPPSDDARNFDDALFFLDWLRDHADLSDEDRDAIACQRAQFNVEEKARASRPVYLEFHRRWKEGDRDSFAVIVNPTASFFRVESGWLLDEDSPESDQLVSFAVESEVRTAVIDQNSKALLVWLAAEPETPLHALSPETRETVQSLAEMGLIATVPAQRRRPLPGASAVNCWPLDRKPFCG